MREVSLCFVRELSPRLADCLARSPVVAEPREGNALAIPMVNFEALVPLCLCWCAWAGADGVNVRVGVHCTCILPVCELVMLNRGTYAHTQTH